MHKIWIGGALGLIGLLLWAASGSLVLADDPTPTHTPTSTAAFVLPLINVPIVLPTAFMPPPPTLIVINVTAAPNGNPLGLQLPANPIWIWNEGNNWAQAIVKVIGWAGYLLFFVLLVRMCLSLMNNIRRAAMGQPSLFEKADAPRRQRNKK